MKIYYVGNLVLCDPDNENASSKFKLTLKTHNIDIKDEITYSKIVKQDDKTYFADNIKSYLNALNGITDKRIVSILNNSDISFYYEYNDRPFEIIYEIIEDESGKHYGKELITGLLFPIMENPDIKYCHIYNLTFSTAYLYKTCTYVDEKLIRFKYALNMTDIASVNKINYYKAKVTSKKRLDKFTNKITTIYNENVFKNEIIEKQDKQHEKKNETIQVMEDIEYLLLSLKKYNYSLYSEFKERYKDICNKYKSYSKTNCKDNCNEILNSYNPIKKELLDLLSSIKLHLMIKSKGCSNLSEYLNVLIEEYLDKIINKESNNDKLNIKFIDKINDIFLKDKDSYDLSTQHLIIKRISLLYLLIVKNNNHSIDQLEESYFKDNIKSIILNIYALYDIGIIKNIPQINFSEELSLSDLITIINNSEFHALEERHKTIIKTKFNEFFIH